MGRLIELEGTSGEAHDPFEWPLPSLGPWHSGTVAPGLACRGLPSPSPSVSSALLLSPCRVPSCSGLTLSVRRSAASRLSAMWICVTDRQILVLRPYISVSHLSSMYHRTPRQYCNRLSKGWASQPLDTHSCSLSVFTQPPILGLVVDTIAEPIPAPELSMVQAGVALAGPPARIGLIAAPLDRAAHLCASLEARGPEL